MSRTKQLAESLSILRDGDLIQFGLPGRSFVSVCVSSSMEVASSSCMTEVLCWPCQVAVLEADFHGAGRWWHFTYMMIEDGKKGDWLDEYCRSGVSAGFPRAWCGHLSWKGEQSRREERRGEKGRP